MTDRRPMGRPPKARMLYYDDARHAYLYTVEPPPEELDVLHPVDVVSNSMVDTFVFGLGIGRTMSYGTQVGEIWFDGAEDHVANWRARETVLSLLDQGRDPLRMLIDRAHHHGMDFYASLRLAANNLPEDPVRPDFSAPEARQERFALIEEAVTRYGVDGVELDCAYEPNSDPVFRPEHVDAGLVILTDFVRQVRELVDEAARRRGRPIALGVRVLPTPAGNQKAGLDVPVWLEEDLVDFIVPIFYVDENMDQNLPFEALSQLAHRHDCYVYPGVRPFYRKDPDRQSASPAMYRAAATNFLHKGADALYMMQLNWPYCTVEDDTRVLLSYIGDMELMHRRSRHYFITPRLEQAAIWDYTSPLPMELAVVGDGAGQSFTMYVGDDLPTVRRQGLLRSVTLRLHIDNVSRHDCVEVSVNGQQLPASTRTWDPVGYSYAWIGYPLWEILPQSGPNTIEVVLRSRPAQLGGPITLAEAELFVDFVQQRNRSPFDQWS
ncbi:MAG: hypothetical protein CME24_15650 [Gemmatimonadetes bacterium]|nr:hypothetical protein [Gemmatimonadota bacterium]